MLAALNVPGTVEDRPLRIAMLAPPWIPIPPPGYGGIELVVASLAEALVRRGHRITLFAAPGSRSTAEVRTLLDRAHPDEIERSLHEADHVGLAFDAIETDAAGGDPFDVVHDHCGFTGFAMARRLSTPLLHTLHGPFNPDTVPFYARHAHKAWVVGLSLAQLRMGPPGLRAVGAIPNPLDVAEWPFEPRKKGYLLWIGRMTPDKGPHRAIEVARRDGRPLILAGPIQTGQQPFFDSQVAPHIDGEQIRYIGEVGGAKKHNLFAGADALLMPIRWPEPFGMVMIEAMACGTPVIAFDEGSARELIIEGETGFLVDDEAEMVARLRQLDEIDPTRCRSVVAERYDSDVVAAAYEEAYRRVIAEARRERSPRALSGIGSLALPQHETMGDYALG